MQNFRLTYPQQNIWLVEKVNKDLPINSIVGTVEINAKFDEKICNDAINYVIKNNDAMRINIVNVDGVAYQTVKEFEYKNFEVVDMSLNSESEIEEYINGSVLLPLLIDENELFEFKIFNYGSGKGAIFMKIHHIISDAWSCSKIGTQLIEYMQAKLNGEEVLDEIKPSYIEFVEKEIEYENSEKYTKDETFWNEYLKDVKEAVSLSNVSNDMFDTKASRYSVKLDEELNNKINEYCKENRISPYALFMGALATYLYRVKETNDFVIGTPILNRSNFKEKQMLGMFISTIPMRIKITESIKFVELAKEIGKNNLELFRHQKYPYPKALEYVRNNSDIKTNLYNIVLSYQNARADLVNNDVYSTTWAFVNHLSDELQIHVMDMDNTGVLNINYDYKTSLFSDIQIKYLHERIMAIIEDALNNIDVDIENIRIMSKDEENKILYEFNNTSTDYPKDKTVIDLFEEQVKKNPDKVALVFENNYISYKEFYNRICNFSAKLNNIKNENIIVSLENSIEFFIAVFGILKSGNTYIPVNINTPITRIEKIAKDSKCKYALMKNKVLENVEYLDVSYNPKLKNNLVNYSKSNGIAYIIYTSGSTGEPKGVVIENKSLTNYINWAKNKYVKDEKIKMPFYSSIGFDLTVTTIFLPLVCGGEVIIYKNNPQEIIKVFKEDKVNTVKLTPAHLSLINSFNIKFSNIKTLIIGGETLKTQDVKKIITLGNNIKIFNEYGPTEATVGCMIYEFNNTENESTLPIGKAIYNTKIYILNSKKEICPLGCIGELYIEGEGVAQKYNNLKEKTEESFIMNPNTQKIMYKTNDLAMIDFDMNVKYFGRLDRQIKINGNRIELEEIENVAKSSLDVKNVVVDVKYISNIPNICLYYISDKKYENNFLRNILSQKLPKYMLPTVYVKIDKVPLNNNGKIEREKLKVPTVENEIYKKKVVYKSKLEKIVCEIWKDILNINKISPEANIFDYGVDSLNIIRCQVKLSNFTKVIDVQKFYEYPVIREFCENIDTLSRDEIIDKKVLEEYKNVNYKKTIDNKQIKNVLLLGATGFLGQHVLKELINCESIEKVFCIVRGKNYKQRLKERFEYYFNEKEQIKYDKKVIVVQADIEYNNLNLSNEKLEELMKNIDRVINCAAIVKHYGKYSDFESINVNAVKNISSICIKYNLVLDHISTMSIAGDRDIEIFDETKFYIGQNYRINPYIQTKFKAEFNILNMIKNNGLNANIFRIGNLTWRISDGKYQRIVRDNGFFMRIKNIIDLKKYPTSFNNMELEMSPVDLVAEYIISLIIKNNSKVNEIYHLYNPEKIKFLNLVKILKEEYDKELNEISDELFVELLKKYDSRENIILNDIVSSIGTIDVKLDNNYTLNRLKDIGIEWKELNEEYIKNLVNYLN